MSVVVFVLVKHYGCHLLAIFPFPPYSLLFTHSHLSFLMTEAVKRSAEFAKVEDETEIDVEHLAHILPQYLLDV